MLTFEKVEKYRQKQADIASGEAKPPLWQNKKKLIILSIVVVVVGIGLVILYKKVYVKGKPGNDDMGDGGGAGGGMDDMNSDNTMDLGGNGN